MYMYRKALMSHIHVPIFSTAHVYIGTHTHILYLLLYTYPYSLLYKSYIQMRPTYVKETYKQSREYCRVENMGMCTVVGMWVRVE